MLTGRQAAFVREFVACGVAKHAAIRAGYSEKSAEAQAGALMKNPRVAEAIAKGRARLEERTNVTGERILLELARIAFSDITQTARIVQRKWPNGKTYMAIEVVPTDQLDEHERAALSEISEGKQGLKVKQHDKVKALELLMRNKGMLEKTPQIIPQGDGTLVVQFVPAAGSAPAPAAPAPTGAPS